ncbi:MAG TPA: caspase family protein [Thermoguttaceae bacterium]|nr:caspase family protein [Thermoguttaceae bacterium]
MGRSGEDSPAGEIGYQEPPARLIAVVVGIDRYADRGFPMLSCAVNDAESVSNAIRRTQPPESLDMAVLTYPSRQGEGGPPTRENVLAALRHAAEVAGPEDTVLFFFAGHGELVDGRPCLVPHDAQRSSGRGGAPESLLGLDELLAVFEGHPSRQRVMFLDCCQTGRAGDPQPGHAQVGDARDEAAGEPATAATGRLLEAIQHGAQGWSTLLSCSPGEESLEDLSWGQHGIFSHFLAEGLRGEADLNRDGVVSLAELVQYVADRVPSQAEAVIDQAASQERRTPPQKTQTPTLVWSGPVDLPVTRSRPEGRTGFQIAVFALWWRFLWQPLPYEIALETRARFGGALLYGLAMALNVALFGLPSAPPGWGWLAAGAGLATALVFWASFALAGAANEIRWHSGGYRAAEMLLGWHVVVFLAAVAIRSQTGGDAEPGAAFYLAIDLFVLISLVIVFATNALHCLIALADLLKKNDRVALRRAFVQLDKRWIHADIPNVLAMVSGHPKLYQVVGWSCCGLVLVHAIYVLLSGPLALDAQMALLRDAVLIVLVQWLAQWYSAAFRMIRGKLLSEK